MNRTATTYLGLNLKNPIIIGSSPLTASLEKLKKCEDGGAAAVVLKSIFEEQIETDVKVSLQQSEGYETHVDSADFLEEYSRNFHIDSYLNLVEKAKESLSIPVIASINCHTEGSWLDYVSRFAEVGADAIELNYHILPSDFKRPSQELETEFIHLVKETRARTALPLSIKIGSHFTALANIVKQLDDLGVNGLVLFNRFYQPDIDIEKLVTRASIMLSGSHEYTLPLQWTALLSAYLNLDICASTGIHSGKTLIKMLLSGAKAVQLCSVVMQKGHKVIKEMLDALIDWMDRHENQDFVAFRGKLAHKRVEDPSQWERTQYMKSLNREF
ncbi:MAG: dihydroorotate dehydrogenase-like protein [Sphaerochaetaceae bacterium]